MRNFADSLVRRIDELENPTVVGLDTKLDYIPQHIKDYAETLFPEEPTKATAKAIWLFNKEIIDQTCDIVPAVKLQYAYYEMYGYDAIKTMLLTARYAQKKGMLVIGDCKRNDIGSTATAYAEAIIGKTDILLNDTMEMSGLDACTVNCYLGIDGVKPFIDVCKRDGKGIFCLVKTSNPSSGDFQDLELSTGGKLYESVAAKVAEWGEDLIGEEGFSSVGAVIGGADEAVASFTAYGKGGIVNASRSIMTAWKARSDYFGPEDFGKAARFEAEDMKEKLNAALHNRKYV